MSSMEKSQTSKTDNTGIAERQTERNVGEASVPVLDRIRSFFSSRSWNPREGIVVAFSGGADSSALLYLLSRLVPASSLVAVYVNHRLRPAEELAGEIAHNTCFCAKLGIEIKIVDSGEDVISNRAAQEGDGIEAAARAVRYEILEAERARLGFPWIATGHTSDDQMETILHRLLRGCSVAALRGIEPVNGSVIRPLLDVSGTVLRSLLKDKGLSWSEDSTNAMDDYTRNRIRHDLVPVIMDIFPSARETLYGFSKRAGAAARFMEVSLPRFADFFTYDEGNVSAPLDFLRSLERHVMGEAVFGLWNLLHQKEGRNPRKLGFAALERLQDMIAAGEGRIFAWGSEAFVADGRFWWHFREEGSTGWCIPLEAGEGKTLLPDASWCVIREALTETFSVADQRLHICHEALVAPLMLRTWEEGDRMMLTEGTKTISDMLSAWKIPARERTRVFLLEDARGIQAVFASAWGGRDRMAAGLKAPHLAGKKLTLYSVQRRNDCCGK
ncbi:tRNA lysidine(34) synthetase TilS [Parasphaerochaeta coccoides]|uniref:tRNA(Ile)-lysidine synthase n=1 Tax=Parasphaerochaeta coccoides (strain ATCC BAA-1237 / DSM 17374 / SPN1) TaxID=760011 RepID=F4GIR1_PARC1|nr:tRNA lysidine(34) synthetase TilS [Parasphaerochaeta coccoides]AEC02195.1 tRNA(Ile)-lysidine synthase [Parasphaerochaeta coccoides DSM 17374]